MITTLLRSGYVMTTTHLRPVPCRHHPPTAYRGLYPTTPPQWVPTPQTAPQPPPSVTRAPPRIVALYPTRHADGTFKTAPLIFKQLYSIHAKIGSNTLVAGACFSCLNTLLTWNSTNLNIVVDLELAAFNAFTSEGLQTIYSTDVDFGVNEKMLAALAFVPLQDIVKAFE
ncbi:Uncharacterized protein FWK35_00020368 [Aphis craccivora]|uniref:Uncharacterized protein n=1 Tax=Aphis craccivora TaxID=307492 RepID=A0A6G0X5J8_APHCR|nr:Uncharacterized protein FWK35_00020368 [Aphis craccivora]